MGNWMKLTAKQILEEDFEIEYKGYKCEEVDRFLDAIADDYKLFESKLASQVKEIQALQEQLSTAQESLEQLKSAIIDKDERLQDLAAKGVPFSDVIRRLSELENNNLKK